MKLINKLIPAVAAVGAITGVVVPLTSCSNSSTTTYKWDAHNIRDWTPVEPHDEGEFATKAGTLEYFDDIFQDNKILADDIIYSNLYDMVNPFLGNPTYTTLEISDIDVLFLNNRMSFALHRTGWEKPIWGQFLRSYCDVTIKVTGMEYCAYTYDNAYTVITPFAIAYANENANEKSRAEIMAEILEDDHEWSIEAEYKFNFVGEVTRNVKYDWSYIDYLINNPDSLDRHLFEDLTYKMEIRSYYFQNCEIIWDVR